MCYRSSDKDSASVLALRASSSPKRCFNCEYRPRKSLSLPVQTNTTNAPGRVCKKKYDTTYDLSTFWHLQVTVPRC